MVDFAMDVHKSLYPDREVPNTLKDKRAEVVENFKKLQGETEPVLKIFVDPEVTLDCWICRVTSGSTKILSTGSVSPCNFLKFSTTSALLSFKVLGTSLSG